MRHRTIAGLTGLTGLSLAAALATASPAAAAGREAPHPTPFGPQRPYEPDVTGPDNIEDGTVAVAKDGGTRDGVTVEFDGSRSTETGEKPAAPREFVFLFDKSIHVDPTAFPTCERSVIEAGGTGACPDGSLVGTGHAEFYGGGSAGVEVYNTRFPNGMRGVLITIPANGTILDNTLERVVGKYRKDFGWGLNEIVPPDGNPPEQRGATSRFVVTFGATRNGASFLESDAPAGSMVDLGVWSEYVTGQVTVNQQQARRP